MINYEAKHLLIALSFSFASLLILFGCGGSSDNSTPANDGQDSTSDSITLDNHTGVLALVFDIYTGNAYRENVLLQPTYSDTA